MNIITESMYSLLLLFSLSILILFFGSSTLVSDIKSSFLHFPPLFFSIYLLFFEIVSFRISMQWLALQKYCWMS